MRPFVATMALAGIALSACQGDGGEPGNGPELASKQPKAVAEARARGVAGGEGSGSEETGEAPAGESASPTPTDGGSGVQGSADAGTTGAAAGTETGADASGSPGNQGTKAGAEARGASGKKKARGPRPAPKETVKATVVGKEFQFSPSRITAPPGAKVAIQFKNQGTITHNITFKKLPHKTPTISPDNTATLEFTAPRKPGTYEFVCKVVGHAAAGMKGALVVEKKK